MCLRVLWVCDAPQETAAMRDALEALAQLRGDRAGLVAEAAAKDAQIEERRKVRARARVCVCVRVCVCAGVRACERGGACVRACVCARCGCAMRRRRPRRSKKRIWSSSAASIGRWGWLILSRVGRVT